MSEIDQLSINALRFLAVDAVEKANSGHPGAPLGDSPAVYLLFHQFMRHNPANAKWTNRDRFVLSNGHASAMLYAVLHLSGYKVAISDLQQFRQWESITPGHPEYGDTDGVEVTTGPLGQGFAMGVGMAIAEAHLAARYNKPDIKIVDHFTYVMCGDGDVREGVSHEAASLAGTLHLGKMIYLYDDNLVSLDGPTDLSFTENVTERFEAYGWHVQYVDDGNDLEKISEAIKIAQSITDKPSLIRLRTIIGYGSPKAGTNKVHGEALGAEAVKATKKALNWPEDKTFYVPEEAAKNWSQTVDKGKKYEQEWNDLFAAYKAKYPADAAEFERTQAGKLADGWEKSLPIWKADAKPIATRSAGGEVMEAIFNAVPELIGGAADLTTSTKTIFKTGGNFHLDPAGRNIFFGVREFGMCAAVNGMAVHGGLIPFGSTFFTFSDYAKPALRLAAIMHSHSLFVFTHDSIALGEDGPTHQPIEQLAMLRAVPHLTDFRPADANETSAVWKLALERKSPSFMALSRQNLPILDPDKYKVAEGVRKGAYILVDAPSPDLVIAAAGAEVWPVLQAASDLKKEGISVRVISIPSFRIFEEQGEAYRHQLFPDKVPALAVEAAAPMPWWKYVGREGDVIGLERFGASAPGQKVLDELGYSPANITKRARALLDRVRPAAATAAK
jgi:transketolase